MLLKNQVAVCIYEEQNDNWLSYIYRPIINDIEMKEIDVKHIAYHVLVGLYFVWLFVFGTLIAMALVNALSNGNYELNRVFVVWMFFNLVMGTVLFIVIRLFKQENIINKIVFYTYYLMAAVTVTAVLIIRNM